MNVQRSRSFHAVIGLGVAGVVAATAAGACQNTTGGSGKTGSGSGGGGVDTSKAFTPKGCGFQIAPREEYKNFKEATSQTSATPNISRVRLGLGGNVDVGASGRADPATTAGFAWQTDPGTAASDVAWGTKPDPTTWSADDRTSGVTWVTEGELGGEETMHEAYACGLSPATTYYYRVGGGPSGSEVWSDVFSFTTTPAGGAGGTVTFAVTGDSRGELQNAWQILQRRVQTLGVTAQLFSGDMTLFGPDEPEWAQWLDDAWKDSTGYLTLAQMLTLSAHGNHENHTTLFFGNMVLPQDVKHFAAYSELFYSVDIGPVHVVVSDDMWVADPSGDVKYAPTLAAWLEADLTAAEKNRSKVPWIVTMHHRPEYSSSTHGQDPDVLTERQFYTPIWDKHHVDMAFSGHDHDYERSKPLTTGSDPATPNIENSPAQGTVYVVCAGSGADPYTAGTSTFTQISHDFANGGAIGLYGILTATKSSLKLDAHELRADGSDPVVDTITITK